MSGTGVCRLPSLASQLRKEANEINDKHDSQKVESMYCQVIRDAKMAAHGGCYATKFYHDNLDDSQTVRALTKRLSNDGFTCSSVYEDSAYSDHAGKKMLYIDVSW